MSERLGYDFHEYADLFPMLDDVELGELTEDIRRNGLIEDIVLYEGKILDGRNRYLACREAGVEPRFVQHNGRDPIVYVVSKNLHRRHLTSSQRAVIALDVLPRLEARARARQRATLKQGDEHPVSQMFDEREQGRADEQAAALYETNRQYISDAKRLAEEAPDLLDQVREKKLTLPKAKRELEERQRLASVQAYSERVKEMPVFDKVYNVVYADPAWQYQYKWGNGVAENHYKTMSLEDICALPGTLGLRVADDAVLFLWVTNPFLAKALRVVEAWGFEYKTNIAWVKTDLDRPGVGHYVRGRHELLYICTRGSFTPLDKHLSPPIGSVLEAPLQEHSRKPDEVYGIIERLYPHTTRIELFARQQRDGWDAWGNECDA